MLGIFYLTVVLVLCSPLGVFGASYYFANSGNDAAPTSSSSTPWQTLAKLGSITLQAGDTVLFNKGDTFRGQINVIKSGTASAPIVYSAYGTASTLPTIKASVLVSSGWSVYSGNIYKATVTTPVSQVFVDGEVMTLARYPNTGFLRSTSMTGWNLKSANLTHPTGFFTNSTIKLRTTNWSYDQSPVSAYTSSAGGGVLTLSNQQMSEISFVQGRPNWGFYLENKLTLLDAPGEWFYDTPSKTLYLWMPSSINPNGANVEATIYSYGVYNGVQSKYFRVQNIIFTQQLVAGVYTNGANNVVNACQFSYQSLHGVQFEYSTNITVSNCMFTKINSHAITYTGITTGTINNNYISRIGLIAGTGIPGTGGIAGISLEGSSAKINVLYNRVTYIGYIGIRFDGASHRIEGNVIDLCMLTLDDGGGIYCWGTESAGSLIKNNIVYNIYPNTFSTPDYADAGEAHCLYFDDWSNGHTALNNTLYNCLTSNIYVHDSPSNIIRYNVLYNSTAQISFFDQFGNGATYNNTIDRNYMLAAKPSQLLVDEYTAFQTTSNYAKYSNNIYAAPYNGMPFYAQPSSGNANSYSFAQWVSLKATQGEKFGPYSNFPLVSVIGYYGSNLVSSTAPPSAYACWCPVNGCSVTSISSAFCSFPNSTVSTCYSLNAPSGAGTNALQASTPSFPLVATYNSKPAVYEISLVAFASVQHNFYTAARMAHSPYSDLSGEDNIQLQPNQPQKIVRYFTPSVSDAQSRLDIQSTADISKISFSQVSVRLANTQSVDLSQTTGIIVNPTNTAVQAGPLKSGVAHYDLQGNQYSFPLTLAPYSSVLVVFK